MSLQSQGMHRINK